MQKFDVQISLDKVAAARAVWAEEQTKFTKTIEDVMRRLLHEAARNFMSPEEVAAHSGFTVKRVRALMRDAGLHPRDGKNLLSKKAAEALSENAELLGIEPGKMDLMSPLAYLPMGEKLKAELQEQRVHRVTELPEDDVSGNGLDDSGERMRQKLIAVLSLESGCTDPEAVATAVLAAGWHQ